VRRTSSAPVYATAVPARAELAARVTLQQLEILDSAGLRSVAVAAADGVPRTYVLWGKAIGFGDFVTRAAR
jgi:hypothetical protein